ncbi:uncharacterized protein LOC122505190 [Leptopilina heterotoma]|uniref:uncharacterized protein LOC122505190 n=1 Tax=Leptopilina heterotoma TaxID=63436 RepID=UPI001CAA2F8C|nr:uncharacterized protein LOC122505190 [Leptopilina heterotoma]
MEFQRKILLLLILAIFSPKQNAAEQGRASSAPFDENICSLYDNTKLIDDLLFTQNSKPLVIIIADNMIHGIQRAKDLSLDRRIFNNRQNRDNSQFYEKMMEKIYLYESREISYFVYPVNMRNNLLTTYCQRKLINDSFSVMFHFLNSMNEFPFVEEIFIPLKPHSMCTKHCTFIEYIKEKMQIGENFLELFELRKRLFSEEGRKHFFIRKIEKIDLSLFYENSLSQNESSMIFFNSLLVEIQNSPSNSLKENGENSKSLECFQTRCLHQKNDFFQHSHSAMKHLRNILILIEHLNLLNSTIFSLDSSDASFENFCNMIHYSDVIKLFCFIKDLSDATSLNIEAWISNLKLFAANSLIGKLSWFNRLLALYKNQYYLDEKFIETEKKELSTQTINFEKSYGDWFQFTLVSVRSLMETEYSETNHETFENISVFYDYWETIDELIFDVEIEKLVIILTDDVAKGIHVLEKMTNNKRVKPKKNRNDLHYTEQFLYDIIEKNFHLFQSSDTYYYVYPTQLQNDMFMFYLHFMIFKDYSKTTFHVVKFEESFSPSGDNSFTDTVIPAITNPSCIQLSKYSTNIPKIFLNYYLLQKIIYFYDSNTFRKYAANYNDLSLLLAHYDVCDRNTGSMNNIFYSIPRQRSLDVHDYIINLILKFDTDNNLDTKNNVFLNVTNLDTILNFQRTIKTAHKNIKSNNDTDLKALCNLNQNFKLLKLFCFLKNNYHEHIEDSNAMGLQMLSFIDNLKNFFTTFLENTNDWLKKLLAIYYNVYVWEKAKILIELQGVYNDIPYVSRKNDDLLKKMIFIVDEKVMSLKANLCPCTCSLLSEEKYKFQIEADVINFNEYFKKTLCPGDVKVYEFFALHKIIFDKNINAVGKELEIIIIAPIWEVSGNIKLDFSGEKYKRRDSNLTGRQGGTFFGMYVTLQLSNNDHLKIDVSSGYKMNGKGIILPFSNNQSFKFTTKLTIKSLDTRNDPKIVSYHSTNAVMRYKKLILSSMLKYNNSDYKFLYTNLSNNSEILNDYTTMDIIDELYSLEEFYLQDDKKLDSLFMYKVYKKGIIYKILNMKKNNDSYLNDDQTIQHLNTFYTRKIKNLEEGFYKKPILHINDYLKFILSDANSIQNLDILNRFQIIVNNFTQEFREEIAEGEKRLIDIGKYVKEKTDELNQQIGRIKAEIDTLHEQKKNESLQLKENKILLGENKIVKQICGTIKIISSFAALINPFFAVGGALLLSTATVVESLLVKPVNDVVHIKIPNTIYDKLEESNINRQAQNKYSNITLPAAMSKNIKDYIKNYDDLRKQPVAGIEGIHRELFKDYTKEVVEQMKTETEACSNQKVPGKCQIETIKKHKEKLHIMGSYNQQKHLNRMKNLNKIPFAADNLLVSVDVFNDIRKTDALEEEMINQANESDQELENLEKFNKEVEDTLKPKIENLRNIFNTFSDGFVNASTTTFLEFEKWRVDEELSKYFKNLKSWVKDLKIADEFQEIMDNLEVAIQTTIKFHILVKEFKSKIDNAEYMEHLVAAPFHEIFTNDPNLRVAYTKLSHFYYANQILDEYTKWLISFKQYTFPCMNYYPEIKEIYFLDTKSPVMKANSIIQAMKSVNKHLNKIEAEGYSAFIDFRVGNFGNGTSRPPFYEWNSSLHYSTIKEMLDGKQVKLFANISHFDKYNAVKFRDIHLLITSNKYEEELRRDLSNISLTLRHNGDNYYRCDDNIHLIQSGVLQLNFDTIYSKADQFIDSEKNDYVLSPFATWTVQLMLNEKNETFKSLSKYADNVNIKLIGDGKFMRMNMNICEDDLWIYYGNRRLNLEASP